MNYPLIEP